MPTQGLQYSWDIFEINWGDIRWQEHSIAFKLLIKEREKQRDAHPPNSLLCAEKEVEKFFLLRNWERRKGEGEREG